MDSLSNEIIVMTFSYLVIFDEPRQPEEQPHLTSSSKHAIYSIRSVNRRFCHLVHEHFAKVIEQKPVRLMEADLDMLEYITRDEAIYTRMTTCIFSTVLPFPKILLDGHEILQPQRSEWQEISESMVREACAASTEYNNLARKQLRFNHSIVQYLTGIFKRLHNLKVVATENTNECVVRVPRRLKYFIKQFIMDSLKTLKNGQMSAERDHLVLTAIISALHDAGRKPVRVSFAEVLIGLLQMPNNRWQLPKLPSVTTLSVAPLILYQDDYETANEEELSKMKRIMHRFWTSFPSVVNLQLCIDDEINLTYFQPLMPRTSSPTYPNLTMLQISGPMHGFLGNYITNDTGFMATIVEHCCPSLRHLRLFMHSNYGKDGYGGPSTILSCLIVELSNCPNVLLQTLYVQMEYYEHSTDLLEDFIETILTNRRFAHRSFLCVQDLHGTHEETEFEVLHAEELGTEESKELWQPERIVVEESQRGKFSMA
ncbi:hypothetical protein SLS56_008496 [Neofusicoccum ribis]|uniref:Uncharacterized protein n=1 Tax=Neofusicoccum ribis TaxID=45134 RepID=A0ABR3SJW0_9PEZI